MPFRFCSMFEFARLYSPFHIAQQVLQVLFVFLFIGHYAFGNVAGGVIDVVCLCCYLLIAYDGTPLAFYILAKYFDNISVKRNELCPALLPDVAVENTLGDVLAAHGLSQLRIAETEKYNHVTYFMDAERNVDFPLGDKVLIPSPDVATFDMKPEMSAVEITDALLPILGDYDVVILNWANGDMVGHTGNLDAAVRAMETLDEQLARLVPAVLKLGGTLLITADHGNAEQMWDAENNLPWTAHTTNPVNLVVVADNAPAVRDGGLSDIAPTMLKILGIPQPDDMTGVSLI